MNFHLYLADVTGSQNNCNYRHEFTFSAETTLQAIASALCRDYTCTEFKNGYRSMSNFISADCLAMDCDNDHSDNPSDWVVPDDVADVFPNVGFVVHYSRSHLKMKGTKAPRPRFHIIFPIDKTSDVNMYSEMKMDLLTLFPFFDSNCKDSARFYFGTSNAAVEIRDGSMNLSDFLRTVSIPREEKQLELSNIIPEGRRNSTLSVIAVKLLKKYGDCKKSQLEFKDEAARCVPPLGSDELRGIWRSALNCYQQKIETNPSYVPPEKYNEDFHYKYKPGDYSHVAQAQMLAMHFGDSLRYTPATGYLYYNGAYWEESETKARSIVHTLTDFQLKETEHETGSERPYFKFVKSARCSSSITSTLKEAEPMLEIPFETLDSDPYLLCTPSGTYDLSVGMDCYEENEPGDFITKCTSVSPGDDGEDIWFEFLDNVFCGDIELIEYVQTLCGMAAIGKVMDEALIISYGNGGNGKSTFWNTILKVMGKYGDNISSDVLTFNCKRNVAPEIADIRGKRLLISSETQENARLDEAMIKKLCSTDNIRGEKKYRDPMSFTPTHTIMLFTNHLPKVGSTDDGIWRRLKVIPFNAKFSGANDIKGFSDELFDTSGPAVLKWIIQGAKLAIGSRFQFEEPLCVKKAIAEYRENSNWFHQFISDCCEVGDELQESSQLLYDSYRSWCLATGEYVRGRKDFYSEVDREEYRHITQKRQRMIKGIKLKEAFPGSSCASKASTKAEISI